MTQIELFAGIGGFGLAGHWTGIETICQVEIDPFCQKVLQKNFPNAHRHADIFTFDGRPYAGTVDVISGGFPCQPFSAAGRRKGTDDDRYLWPEMLRVIREVGPRWVVGENVAGFLSMDGGRVFEQVCSDLENAGYTVEAFVIPACAVGAPHRRDRVWIIANTESGRRAMGSATYKWETIGEINTFSNAACLSTNSCGPRSQRGQFGRAFESGTWTPRPTSERYQNGWQWAEQWPEVAARLCRMDDGFSGRVDRNRGKRLKALGNSIVPKVAYQIFKSIIEYDSHRR